MTSTPCWIAKVANVCPYGIIRTNRKTIALQRVDGLPLFFFHWKWPPKWGYGEGVIKQGCTLRTNFWTMLKEVKMGSWGITMRQSDYGLDLLGTIVDTRLKTADFLSFHVADALELIKTVIIEEIRHSTRGYSSANLVSFFSKNFPRSFTQGGAADCRVPCRLLLHGETYRI